jgi:hypothetical protein
MTYAELMAELRHLIPEGEALLRSGATHLTEEFLSWRHETGAIVEHPEILSRQLPATMGSYRQYQAPWSPASAEEDAKAFQRDMSQTLTELRLLLKHFDEFGVPTRKNPSAEPPSGASHEMAEHFRREYWQIRAEEARATAATFSQSQQKRIMLGIAEAYDQLASGAGQLEKSLRVLGKTNRRFER